MNFSKIIFWIGLFILILFPAKSALAAFTNQDIKVIVTWMENNQQQSANLSGTVANQAPPPAADPEVTLQVKDYNDGAFKDGPVGVPYGIPATLQWEIKNVSDLSTCNATPAGWWDKTKNQADTPVITADSTFALTCGAATKTVSVNSLTVIEGLANKVYSRAEDLDTPTIITQTLKFPAGNPRQTAENIHIFSLTSDGRGSYYVLLSYGDPDADQILRNSKIRLRNTEYILAKFNPATGEISSFTTDNDFDGKIDFYNNNVYIIKGSQICRYNNALASQGCLAVNYNPVYSGGMWQVKANTNGLYATFGYLPIDGSRTAYYGIEKIDPETGEIVKKNEQTISNCGYGDGLYPCDFSMENSVSNIDVDNSSIYELNYNNQACRLGKDLNKIGDCTDLNSGEPGKSSSAKYLATINGAIAYKTYYANLSNHTIAKFDFASGNDLRAKITPDDQMGDNWYFSHQILHHPVILANKPALAPPAAATLTDRGEFIEASVSNGGWGAIYDMTTDTSGQDISGQLISGTLQQAAGEITKHKPEFRLLADDNSEIAVAHLYKGGADQGKLQLISFFGVNIPGYNDSKSQFVWATDEKGVNVELGPTSNAYYAQPVNYNAWVQLVRNTIRGKNIEIKFQDTNNNNAVIGAGYLKFGATTTPFIASSIGISGNPYVNWEANLFGTTADNFYPDSLDRSGHSSGSTWSDILNTAYSKLNRYTPRMVVKKSDGTFYSKPVHLFTKD